MRSSLSRIATTQMGVVFATLAFGPMVAPSFAQQYTADGYAEGAVGQDIFFDLNTLFLLPATNHSAALYTTDPNGVELFNADEVEFGTAYGVHAVLGGFANGGNIGFLGRGFYASPWVGDFDRTFDPAIPAWCVEYADPACFGDDLHSLAAVQTRSLWGADGNLMLRMSPDITLYLGAAHFRLTDVLDVTVAIPGESTRTWSTVNSMLGGQLGVRLGFGDDEPGNVFVNVDLRGGLLRNTVARPSPSLAPFEPAEPTNAMTWFAAADVSVGLQVSSSLALSFGYRPVYFSGVALAHDQIGTIFECTAVSYCFGDPSLTSLLAHGMTIGLELRF